MNMMKKILSLLMAFAFIGSNIHIIDSAHFSKVGDYNICALDCEDNEHFSAHDDCDLCNKNVREDFIITSSKSLINDYNNLFFDYFRMVTSNNLHDHLKTRAPPSNIS